MAVIGWPPEVVDELTPLEAREIVAARMVYDDMMYRRPGYDAARMNAFFSMAPHVKKGSLKHPTDLIKFSHELTPQDKKEKPKLTGEALKAEIAKLDKVK